MTTKQTKCDPRKISVYMSHEDRKQIKAEAERLGRPVSWVFQRCWTVAKEHIKGLPKQ